MSRGIDKRMVIRGDSDRAIAARFVQAMQTDHPLVMTIKPYRANRSNAQNSLMWKWLQVIGAELGYTADEIHDQFKQRLLLPLMQSYGDEFEHAAQAMELLAQHPDSWPLISRLVSTTDLKVAHFTEYLGRIERAAAGLGIVLPHPEDLYYEAMGYVRR